MSAEAFLQKHIVEPLGLGSDNMTFELQKHPDMQARRGDMTIRAPVADSNGPTAHTLRYKDEEYWYKDIGPYGGQGVYTTPESYIKVLWSILTDDGKLLKPETRGLLFERVLTPEAEKAFDERCRESPNFALGLPVPPEISRSHSVGGLLTLEDCDGDHWRREGNLSWSGLPNIVWVCGISCPLYIISRRY